MGGVFESQPDLPHDQEQGEQSSESLCLWRFVHAMLWDFLRAAAEVVSLVFWCSEFPKIRPEEFTCEAWISVSAFVMLF